MESSDHAENENHHHTVPCTNITPWWCMEGFWCFSLKTTLKRKFIYIRKAQITEKMKLIIIQYHAPTLHHGGAWKVFGVIIGVPVMVNFTNF